MRFGDRKVLRRQIDYLLEQSERPDISTRVVPFSAGGFASAHAGRRWPSRSTGSTSGPG
ncbi:DUF5753 domain-containing protein [Streptomyces beigongshangae]|uniref:DUF5753 domain-containing protein n=1 Tax=Streptomyces beigongshangae TaxID=2841597 RepID=UPI0021A6582E|nr:DUF5753 domain-containing protein [Streptomyces sp. REN17]